MKCFCCDSDHPLLYHVKLRGDVQIPGGGGPGNPAPFTGPNDPAYQAYTNNGTYRSAFICPKCYTTLDNDYGVTEIGNRTYGIAGASRGQRAALYDEKKYAAFQKRQAAKMGIQID